MDEPLYPKGTEQYNLLLGHAKDKHHGAYDSECVACDSVLHPPHRPNPLNEGLTGGRLLDAQLADYGAMREGFDPRPY